MGLCSVHVTSEKRTNNQKNTKTFLNRLKKGMLLARNYCTLLYLRDSILRRPTKLETGGGWLSNYASKQLRESVIAWISNYHSQQLRKSVWNLFDTFWKHLFKQWTRLDEGWTFSYFGCNICPQRDLSATRAVLKSNPRCPRAGRILRKFGDLPSELFQVSCRQFW